MKPKILGTGLSGMVGTRIVELLGGKYDFEDLSLATGVDITDQKIVFDKIEQFSGDVILHLAAKTDVDGCEKDKDLGQEGDTWKINVLGTKNLVEACRQNGKKIVYISTDFVFDGQAPPDSGYGEEDTPNPINWYGQTKHEGEKVVQSGGGNWLICRLAFPYRARFTLKMDFVRKILSLLGDGKKIQAVSDQTVTPTFIDDLVPAIDRLLDQNLSGIYHLVGGDSLSPYKAAKVIAQTFNSDENLIEGISGDLYFAGRAKRPFKLALRNDKITKLGVDMRSFEKGLKVIKSQLAAGS